MSTTDAAAASKHPTGRAKPGAWGRLCKDIAKSYWLYLMVLPGFLFFVIFKYIPMGGTVIAFQNYFPFLGISKSQWVGFKHFETLFASGTFWMLFRNTIIISLLNLVFFFPAPIIIALLLNEIRLQYFKRTIQTLIYIPHFISWPVVVGIVYIFLTTDGGLLNQLLVSLGYSKINFLASEGWFRPLVVIEMMWKETGWGTIIFLAALAGVDPQLYEAARMDGANRWRQLWHVTLPAIRSTIVILLILRMGDILDLSFEQIYLMMNALNASVSEVFDTFVYKTGIQQGNFSYSAAVGLFKSAVGLIMVTAANYLAKKVGEEGIF